MMILLLDNQDSFVHNLARYFRQTGNETRVIRSNRITAGEALELAPDAVVLSPGPRGPDQAGCCLELIRNAPEALPILGVCLGHQVIGAAFGGRVICSPPRHGMASPIEHEETFLFAGCPNPMNVARYHSLAVASEALPDCLQVTATSLDDGLVMGLRHRQRPIFGVQFHPESVLSVDGMTVVRNFALMYSSIT
jgi:anthranilate synthase/aminodeoxychorismate synthase-like glutamine amidotransferase